MGTFYHVRDLGGLTRYTVGAEVPLAGRIPVNAYRVGTTLFDAGAPRGAGPLLQDLGEAVETVLLTHHHEDHVGAAGPLAQAGIPVLAPERVVPWLARGVRVPPYRWLVWGRPDPVEAEPLPERIETPEGTVRVLPTPGHTPEHVALFLEGRGWLFAGDAFLGARQELRAKEDLGRLAASLQRLIELDPDRLFPGHGRVVEEPAERLQEELDRLETLRDRVQALAARGWSTGRIQRELMGPEGLLFYISQGDFRKRHLVEQLLAWDGAVLAH